MRTLRLVLFFFVAVLAASAAIQYAGGTYVNTTFATTGTRQDLNSAIEDALTTAGWTVDSGSHTATIVMHSASTPTANNNIYLRIVDPGSNASGQFNIQNAASGATLTGQNIWLNAAVGTTYRIIANKYQFFVLVAGSQPARGFLAGGTLYVPAFAQSAETGVLGWIVGVGDSATQTGTNWKTWRRGLSWSSRGGENNRGSTIVAGTLDDWAQGNSTSVGSPRLISMYNADVFQPATGIQWTEGSYMLSDALMAWSAGNVNNPALIRGQLWDATIIAGGALNNDLGLTFDSKNWYTITLTNAGSTEIASGQLLVVVP